MKRLPRLLSFSNVMSVIAVFIALSASAYALGMNTVGSKQIKPDAVRSSELAGGTAVWAGGAFVETAPNGFSTMSPIGGSGPYDAQEHPRSKMVPFDAVIADFHAAGSPMGIGQAREYRLRATDTDKTILSCTVGSGESSCESKKSARVEEGDSLILDVQNGPGGASSGLAKTSFSLTAK